MSNEKLVKLFKFYDEFLRKLGIGIQQHKTSFMRIANLEHLRWMCNNGLEFVSKNKTDKAFRWMGFIQGVLFSEKYFTIEELKKHNKEGK